jgi:hypothetical protein
MALNLATARDRIRHALGDVTDAAPIHPDGLAFYTALLAVCPDEVTAWREGARGLAMYLQHEVISLGSSGDSLGWDTARVGRLLAIAAGGVPYPFDEAGAPVAPASGGSADLEVVW